MEITMKTTTILCMLCILSTILSATVLAAPDQYPGDSSIYGVQAPLQPNVLIVIDDSGSMTDTVRAGDFVPGTAYTQYRVCGSSYCQTNAVYRVSSDRWGGVSYDLINSDVENIEDSCRSKNPKDLLKTTGTYSGRSLKTNGTECASSGSSTYQTGNYINYLNSPSADYIAKIDVAKSVIKNLVTNTSNVKFGLMRFRHTSSYVSGAKGGELVTTSSVPGAIGTLYTTEVKDMDDIFTGTIPNRNALVKAVESLSANGYTPPGETLFEAGRYFSGGAPAFGATNGVAGGSYTSPVEATCQKNYIVFVSDGMATADDSSLLGTIGVHGDFDADGAEVEGSWMHSMDDMAKYLNTTLSYNGNPLNIVTYTIGFGLSGADQDAIDLLTSAADTTHGKGGYFSATSQAGLSNAFTTIMTEIYAVNSSYVAPVVPVSPQNRTYGGSRIYMGFFKPSTSAWQGNLKKYAVSASNYIVDVNGQSATWEDTNGDLLDDRSGFSLPSGSVNGSFRTTSKSFWSTLVDAGNVDNGGVGELLQATPGLSRTLYTVTPTGTSLIGLNSTTSGVQNITPAMLGVADTTASAKLLNYVYGLDAYDSDGDGNTGENRDWIMGDILHSRPVIVNYATYIFNDASEASCATNKSFIFVGSNDGMMHAFRDCDGSEAWGFIPPDVLPNLKNMTDVNKSYYVDSTVSTYIHDKNNNGNIEPLQGDKVILLFGIRRGSGTAAAPTSGAYYALDVTIPASPAFLWKMSNSSPTSGSPAVAVFPELGESWSEPKLVRMKYGSPATAKIVALVGAGYDNANEDGRYGATQTFPATASGVSPSLTGSGADTSSGTSSPTNPKGRGIYAIELASLSESGSPPTITASVSTSATKIWGYTYGSTTTSSAGGKTDPGVTFSFPSEIAAIDSLNSGYANILYAADAGGNIWRFDVGNANTANWTGKKIFSSNPGSGGATDVGRKIFYKPSVVSEPGYRMIIFGTGDREHPLNTNVVDRIYVLKDPGTITTTKTESNLVDVTSDLLQTTDSAGVASIMSQLNSATNFGWYIKLDQHSGEKFLSPPTVFNTVIHATTYDPGASSGDVCLSGNLGTSRLYSLDYKTGEAVMNYDKTNDGGTAPNDRAKCAGGGILARSDREKVTGSGIPSGVVVLITPGGQTKLLTGVGGAIAGEHPLPGGSIIPLYWRQK
jgi:type IV pilus assembly protein PilY1